MASLAQAPHQMPFQNLTNGKPDSYHRKQFQNRGLTPDFHSKVTNGHLKTPSATVEIQSEVGRISFKEGFTIITNLTSPLFGLLHLQKISTILDIRQEKLRFIFFSMPIEHADNTFSKISENLINPTVVKSQVYSDHEAMGVIQHSREDNDDLQQLTVLIENFFERPSSAYTEKRKPHR